jgi:hypothetical protein
MEQIIFRFIDMDILKAVVLWHADLHGYDARLNDFSRAGIYADFSMCPYFE